MPPTVYLDGRKYLVSELTDGEVSIVVEGIFGNDNFGPLLERVAADVGDGDDRELIAMARAAEVDGVVLEIPG